MISQIKSFDNTLKPHHVKALLGACRHYLDPHTDFAIFTPDVREVTEYLQQWYDEYMAKQIAEWNAMESAHEE